MAVGAAKNLLPHLRLSLLLHAGDRVPCIAVFLLPRRIRSHFGAQVILLGLLLGEDCLVSESFDSAHVDLQAVLQEEDGATHQPRLLRTLFRELLRHGDAALQILDHRWLMYIALHEQLGNGLLRAVEPGCPEMKTSSPGAAPLTLHLR